MSALHLNAGGRQRPALAFMASALAEQIDIPPRQAPSQWAAAHFRVPDGPFAGQLWNVTLTPWWREPLDYLGPDSPVNKVVIKKGAQSGATVMALAYLAHSIVFDPCRMMVVQPTDTALTKFSRGKLQPVIDRCEPLKRRVRSQTSRSSAGSTTYIKAFPGGEMVLAIATSASDLSGDTVKKILKDELDRYPDDVGGEGPPSKLIESRRKTFSITGDWKELSISTPTIKGASEIDDEFIAGDQRHWHIKCPDCAAKTRIEYKYLRLDDEALPKPHYIMQCCGVVIFEPRMRRLLRNAEQDGAGWIALNPDGAFPSYHFDDVTSPFETWENIAALARDALKSPAKEASFQQRTLAEAYELKADVPDYKLLMERRVDWKRGHVPPRGLILVGAADVQMRGIYVEILAFAPNRESFVVDTLYLDGDTSSPSDGAFLKLSELFERSYPDAFGGKRRVDMFGVDSGYRSHVVYTWCRARAGALALDGRDGWGRPAIGTPSQVDINLEGRRTRRGATVYPVGTWPLKGMIYSDLRKEGRRAGAEIDPPGYCHFGDWLDETYFRQLTSEHLTDKKIAGRVSKRWERRPGLENHFFDCRVYNLALAIHLGLETMTPEDWASLARMRGLPEPSITDLFAPAPVLARAAPAAAEMPSPPDTSERPIPARDASEDAGGGWLDGHEMDFNR